MKEIEADEAAQSIFGDKMRFFGERSGGRGRHAGLKHKEFVNPQTGIRHSQVRFTMENFDKSLRGDVFAEVYKKPGMFFDSWEFQELLIRYPAGKRRPKKLRVLPKKDESESIATPPRTGLRRFIKA